MRFLVPLLLSSLLLTNQGITQITELRIAVKNSTVPLPAFAYQPDRHPIENQPSGKTVTSPKDSDPSRTSSTDQSKLSTTTGSAKSDSTTAAASTLEMGDPQLGLGYRQTMVAYLPTAKPTPMPKATKVEYEATTNKLSRTKSTTSTLYGSSFTSTPSDFAMTSPGSLPMSIPQGTVSVTVNVLATEISYGVGNPMTPYLQAVFLPSGGGPAQQFPEVQVWPGYTETLSISEGELQLLTRATYNAYQTAVTSSDDPVYAIIVGNGENLNDIIAAKNVQPAFGMQASIESILGSMYDAETGIVTLPPNSVLVLYEMSRTPWTVVDDDYNDCMLLVTFDAPVTTEIILRDSIGEVEEQLVGTVTAASGWNAQQSPPVPMFPIANLTVAQPLTLQSLNFVVGRMTISGTLGAMQYRLRIWESPEAAVASKLTGTVYDIPLVPVQVQDFGVLANGRSRHLISFDLTQHNVILPAGNFVFNLAIISPGSAAGLYGYVEGQSDLIPSESDYGIGGAIPPPGYASLCPGGMCVWTGKAAFKLIASPSGSGQGS